MRAATAAAVSAAAGPEAPGPAAAGPEARSSAPAACQGQARLPSMVHQSQSSGEGTPQQQQAANDGQGAVQHRRIGGEGIRG